MCAEENDNQKRTVVLGVTGGIAAYKACEITSRLVKAGIDVFVVMTENATKFVSPLTFEVLSNHPVAVNMFQRETPWEVEHISLAQRADVFVLAPATANIIAKLANGMGDDMLSTTLLATKAPILIAPAMNTAMWENPVVQANVKRAKEFLDVKLIGPGIGRLACGDIGYGRMEEPEIIVEAIFDFLEPKKDLVGKRVVVTAGPTLEYFDPIRFITNKGSGRMGIALANRARRRGAEVTLVHGPVPVSLPHGVDTYAIETTEEMRDAVKRAFLSSDILIMAAAPGDFKPRDCYGFKIKKTQGELDGIQLTQTVDILSEMVELKKEHQRVVGFAAETNDVEDYAEEKLIRKELDMIVANDVTLPGAGFGVDTNIVTIFRQGGYRRAVPLASKDEIADIVLDETMGLFVK